MTKLCDFAREMGSYPKKADLPEDMRAVIDSFCHDWKKLFRSLGLAPSAIDAAERKKSVQKFHDR